MNNIVLKQRMLEKIISFFFVKLKELSLSEISFPVACLAER